MNKKIYILMKKISEVINRENFEKEFDYLDERSNRYGQYRIIFNLAKEKELNDILDFLEKEKSNLDQVTLTNLLSDVDST